MNNIKLISPKTWWNLECFSFDGTPKWNLLNEANLVTNQGKNANLNIMFHGATQIHGIR